MARAKISGQCGSRRRARSDGSSPAVPPKLNDIYKIVYEDILGNALESAGMER
jgi:hypothetical protein